jgi:hypothetical protein
MTVRIRVYPAGGVAGGYGAQGAVSAQTYFNNKLQSQQQVSNLQLTYERALWGERLEKTKLEEQLKNPYLAMNSGFGAYGATAGLAGLGGVAGLAGLGGLGGVGVPGMGMGLGMGSSVGNMGGIPAGFGGGGAGQTNATNQTSTGASTQTVSNVNTNNQSMQQMPPYGYGGVGGAYYGGGLISNLWRGLFG